MKRQLTWIALGDIAEFVRGITFKPDDVVQSGTPDSVRCMRTKNIQQEIDLTDVWSVHHRHVRRHDQYLRSGDLLVSSANSWNLVGKCCLVPEEVAGSTFGGFISALRVTSEMIEPRYLYRWFSAERTQSVVRSFGRQTTNISNLDFARCLTIPVPVPPVDEQRRIVDVMDRVDELRSKRREAIKILTESARSVFLEMFGDPVLNLMKWPMVKLTDLGTLDRGVSKHRPRNDPKLLGGRYPLIQTGDVSGSGGYITKYSSTYSDLGLAQSRIWPAGTLCITIAANIAKTGILRFDACFPDSVVGFSSDSATAEYVQTWLSFLQENLERLAPESAQKNINLAVLRSLDIPNPGKIYIEEFSRRVNAINELKNWNFSHLSLLDELLDSIRHRAFLGELWDDTSAA